MSNGFITTADGTRIVYKDWGPKTAQPIVFHHGWPLSADDWTLTNSWQDQAGNRMRRMRPIHLFDNGVVPGA